MSFKLIIIYILLIQMQAQSHLYTLVLTPEGSGAACLDGSPTGLYYHEGSGQNKNKYMIYFNSGGFCGAGSLSDTLQACYQRSFGSLGSTKKATPTRSFEKEGLLSTNPTDNPVFFDWTKIYMIYCDGSEYMGSRQQPIPYKDRQLYFRGLNNTVAQFKILQDKFDFYNGEKIVITGVSAGGMATYFYQNYLFQHTKTAKVYAIPDSGLFITDYLSPIINRRIIRQRAQALFKLTNSQGSFIFPQCLKKYDDDIIQCFNTANLSPYFKVPMLIVESPYDEYSIDNIVVAQCLSNDKTPYSLQKCSAKERDAIQDYRSQVLLALDQLKRGRSDVGLWAPSCVQHGFTDMSSFTDPAFKVPSATGFTVMDAIKQFLDDPQHAKWRIDTVGWPGNEGCSGLKSKKLFSNLQINEQ